MYFFIGFHIKNRNCVFFTIFTFHDITSVTIITAITKSLILDLIQCRFPPALATFFSRLPCESQITAFGICLHIIQTPEIFFSRWRIFSSILYLSPTCRNHNSSHPKTVKRRAVVRCIFGRITRMPYALPFGQIKSILCNQYLTIVNEGLLQIWSFDLIRNQIANLYEK